MTNLNIKCTCGKYQADFDTPHMAETAATMHIMLGSEHIIACTKGNGYPKDAYHGKTIVFIANPSKTPKVMYYTKDAGKHFGM